MTSNSWLCSIFTNILSLGTLVLRICQFFWNITWDFYIQCMLNTLVIYAVKAIIHNCCEDIYVLINDYEKRAFRQPIFRETLRIISCVNLKCLSFFWKIIVKCSKIIRHWERFIGSDNRNVTYKARTVEKICDKPVEFNWFLSCIQRNYSCNKLAKEIWFRVYYCRSTHLFLWGLLSLY
jgi:hypothetical protein